jgi:hypothetical protein
LHQCGSSAAIEDRGTSCGDGILKEIQAACILLPRYSFKYGHRDGNRAAHELAQHAMWTKEFVVDCVECPACIRGLVGLEARHLEYDWSVSRQPLGEVPCNLATL